MPDNKTVMCIKRLMTFIILLSVSLVCVAGEFNGKCINGLSFSGKHESVVSTFSFFDNIQFKNDLPIIHGSLNIQNTTNKPLTFSTKMIKVAFNSQNAVRTYKKTIASEMIDIAYIELMPSSKLNFKTYWVPKLKVGSQVENIEVSCHEKT